MKLTHKDQEFLIHLKILLEAKDLTIELKHDGYKYMVLRQNYGQKIESIFGTSRQGVRWRFQRLFNDIYVSAYTTIYWVEKNFGTQLRQMALTIAKDRITLKKEAMKRAKFDNYRLKTEEK